MYPGPLDPDYGAFVATMDAALERQGHIVESVTIDSRARGAVRTPRKYLGLGGRAIAPARRADVIYSHFLFPTGAIAAGAGRAARRPWVITAHGRDVRNLANPVLRRLSSPAITGAAAIIAVSRALADDLRAHGLRLPTTYVAHMGVDLERFQPHDRHAARTRVGVAGDPVIVAVGGLTERKNPLRLIQAFARVRRRHPGAHLVFVGDGPLAGAVRAGAAGLGLVDAITLAGAVPHDAVADWLTAADLLALPSLVEPLGIVALESLASGRPVVATRNGGTAEVVGRGGTLVDPRDPTAIADGLLRVLADPPDPATCRRVAEAHGVDRQAARISRILERAVESRARR
jgi:glycosyltransferase involved in cell wall biosynthesis